MARRATREQALELLALRSVYTLREADAHSWAIPRLTGRPKAALVEIQADEYGGGSAARVLSSAMPAVLPAGDRPCPASAETIPGGGAVTRG